MKARRTSLLIVVGVLAALLLTGCVDVEQMDQNWLARAFLDVSDKIDEESFKWIYILILPCMFFAAGALFRGGGPDWVSFIHWFVIMVIFVGSFFRITEVIRVVGQEFWPSGYTLSAVMDRFGWSLPFPKDATLVSPIAFAFTDLIPSLYNAQQWGLLIIHGAMLIIVAFSRNTKPIVVDLAFILSWAITPSILAFETVVWAVAKEAASNATAKALLEGFYVVTGYGTMVIFFWILPTIVGIAAIFLPFGPLEYSWAGKDRETKALLKKLGERLDLRELGALFGSLFVQPQPPLREKPAYTEANPDRPLLTAPDYIEGSFRDLGPDDFGPSSPKPPQPEAPPGSPGNEKVSNRNGGPGNREEDQPEAGSKENDLFEPRQARAGLEEPSGREDLDRLQDDEPTQSTPPDADKEGATSQKGRLEQGLETFGKAAKVAGPLISQARPEVGLPLTAAGEVLDRDEELFPLRKEKGDTGTAKPSSSDESGEEELFPPRKGGQ